jgi:hypothetical protein
VPILTPWFERHLDLPGEQYGQRGVCEKRCGDRRRQRHDRNTADDLSVANGKITYQSGDSNANNLLDPGEAWLYKATGTVQNLTTAGAATTFDFSGSSATDGSDGNVRTFTSGALSVKTSAFSRDQSTGAWAQAYLGSYGGGLGVTDSSESGSGDTHTVDNMGGRDNYVLFEFNQNVVVDSAFLGYVVGDSDLSVWIGTRSDPFNNHDTMLSDAELTALGFTEVNLTDLSYDPASRPERGQCVRQRAGDCRLDGRYHAGGSVQDRDADGSSGLGGL